MKTIGKLSIVFLAFTLLTGILVSDASALARKQAILSVPTLDVCVNKNISILVTDKNSKEPLDGVPNYVNIYFKEKKEAHLVISNGVVSFTPQWVGTYKVELDAHAYQMEEATFTAKSCITSTTSVSTTTSTSTTSTTTESTTSILPTTTIITTTILPTTSIQTTTIELTTTVEAEPPKKESSILPAVLALAAIAVVGVAAYMLLSRQKKTEGGQDIPERESLLFRGKERESKGGDTGLRGI